MTTLDILHGLPNHGPTLSRLDILTKELGGLRKVVPPKKLLTFGHCPEGGWGQSESKSFGVGFFGPSFGHYGGKEGG